jgi:hypothetical protein
VNVQNGTQTRAYGDGANTDRLRYAVYQGGTQIKLDSTSVNSGTATVILNLVKDQQYTVYFWADNKDCNAYTFDGTQVAIDYSAITPNSEASDAFTATETFTVNGNEKKNITLYRPFAQLNLGTNDLEIANSYFSVDSVKISTKAYKTIDLATGTAVNSDDYVDVTFTAPLPTNETFPISGYKYLAMDYLFVGESVSETVEMIVKSKNGKTVTNNYQSVPMKKNYRTNIAGALLTSQSEWTVSIEANFNGNIGQIWDGTTLTKPTYDETSESYLINSASDLAGFAALVNGTYSEETRTAGDVDYTKANFMLMADIDLAGHEWTPIGSKERPYLGSFNGNNKVISNLKITRAIDDNSTEYNKNIGFFGFTKNNKAEIKDFTIHNAEIRGCLQVGAIAGQPYTTKYSNVHLTGKATIVGGCYVGGLFGKNIYNDLNNATVNVSADSYVRSYRVDTWPAYTGGVIGYIGEGQKTISNVHSNINVFANSTSVGGVSGNAHYGVHFKNCSSSGNVTATDLFESEKYRIGGIAGNWHNSNNNSLVAKFENCFYTGTLSNDGMTDFVNFGLVGSQYNSDASPALVLDYILSTPQQLQLLANEVNVNGKTFAGETITLGANIDLSSIEDWMPIGIITENRSVYAFEGTFDGDNHIIENLTIKDNVCHLEELKKGNDFYGKGFFGIIQNATIKNVTFKNASIISAKYADINKGNIQGIVAAYVRGNSLIEGVQVIDSDNKGIGKLGAIIGYADRDNDIVTFKNCIVRKTTINGAYNMGGLVGVVESMTSIVMEDCDASGTNFIFCKDEDTKTMIDEHPYWKNSDTYYFPISSINYCTRRNNGYPYGTTGITLDGYCF